MLQQRPILASQVEDFPGEVSKGLSAPVKIVGKVELLVIVRVKLYFMGPEEVTVQTTLSELLARPNFNTDHSTMM